MYESNKSSIFAENFKDTLMEEGIFTVCVKIGLQMKFEFDGTLLSYNPESNVFTFAECDDDLIPVKNGDMVVLNMEKRTAAFSCGHLSIASDVVDYKKVGDNYQCKCVTDLSRVDVYVCQKSLWLDKGETIFF